MHTRPNEVAAGLGGAAMMVAAFATPFLRQRRDRWGLDEVLAARRYPGDDLVPEPDWQWTHGIEIEAPTEAVWPWIAQIGADRGGFYSYEWLENLVGCGVHNAEVVHPEWEYTLGDAFRLHPDMPPFVVAALERGRWYVVHAAPEATVDRQQEPWQEASWLLFLEPLGARRCRFVSRFRSAARLDGLARLAASETFAEPIGFVMDRRMLLGVKRRAEASLR